MTLENIQYIISVIVTIIISVISNYITNWLTKRKSIYKKEYSSAPFILSLLAILAQPVALLGWILSIFALWWNAKLLPKAKTKAHKIAFICAMCGLIISAINSTLGGQYAKWIYQNEFNFALYPLPGDHPSLSVKNANELSADSSKHETLYTRARLQDTIIFTVRYRNSSDRDLENVRIRFSNSQYGNLLICSTTIFEEFSNNIYSGHSTISLNNYTDDMERIEVEFLEGWWYPNQSETPTPLPFNQSGIEITHAVGLNIGDVKKDLDYQGTYIFKLAMFRTR